MKILAVSDQIDDRLYHAGVRERYPDVDLLVGCGDLPYEYLEFLVTALNTPLVYVPGNHDPQYKENDPLSQAEGGVCLDQSVTHLKGLLMAGIGGSIRYRPDGINQYTQSEMYYRLRKLVLPLLWHRLLGHRRLDLLIAHSPPLGIHDDDDLAHTGFQALRDFIKTFKPRYFLHGHTMYYKGNLEPPTTRVGETMVINVYPYRVIEME
ncbi:MAG: metallophosphoesterase [Anaerolineales bacterium]|nr:metallophosphoesterase [Anaerolineales bacterium]